jgi:hypothetical protein
MHGISRIPILTRTLSLFLILPFLKKLITGLKKCLLKQLFFLLNNPYNLFLPAPLLPLTAKNANKVQSTQSSNSLIYPQSNKYFATSCDSFANFAVNGFQP